MKKSLVFRLLTLLVAVFVIFGISASAIATQDIIYTTNGAANRYSAGSVLVIYGKVTEDGMAKSNLSVTVDIKDSNAKVIYYGQIKTNASGYFTTNFTVPNGVSGSMIIKLSTNEGDKIKATYSLASSPGTIIVQGSNPGLSLTEADAPEIPVNTSTVAVVFDANVNYFNNRDNNLDMATLGLNTKNEDCFTLYKKTSSGYTLVGSSVGLTIDTTGTVSGLTYFPDIAGADKKNQARNVIYISPTSRFESGITYKLVIDRELSANNSSTLGADVAFYFKTKAAGDTPPGSGSPNIPPVSPTYPDDNALVESITNIQGSLANASVSGQAVAEAITQAIAYAEEHSTAAVIEIKVEADDNTKSLKITIPSAAVDNINTSGVTTVISSTSATLTFDTKAMSTLATANRGDITITVNRLEADNLPENLQNVIGDNPIFEFSAAAGNTTIQNFNGGTAQVAIPYSLPAGKDSESIVIYYINDAGELQVVKNCKYDPVTKSVSFVTDHFSKYAVGSNPTMFDDVVEGAWYKSAVDFVSARELFGSISTTQNIFNGNGTMTRAMFATVLARLDGVDLSTYKTSGFTDIDINSWYGQAVTWAATKGMVNGVGEGKFDPNSNITREQMSVMLYNYMKYKGLSLPGSSKAPFADADSVSSWAKDSVMAMQIYGLINGLGNNEFAPASTATRAQVATIFTNFIKAVVR